MFIFRKIQKSRYFGFIHILYVCVTVLPIINFWLSSFLNRCLLLTICLRSNQPRLVLQLVRISFFILLPGLVVAIALCISTDVSLNYSFAFLFFIIIIIIITVVIIIIIIIIILCITIITIISFIEFLSYIYIYKLFFITLLACPDGYRLGADNRTCEGTIALMIITAMQTLERSV